MLLDGPFTIAEYEQKLYGLVLDEASVVTISDSSTIGNASAFYYIKGMPSGSNGNDTSFQAKIIGVPVAYRVRLYNRSLSGEYDSASRVAIVSMTGTCSDTSCTDTATCMFDTYTSWLYGKSFSVMLFRPLDSYSLFVQARIDDRKMSEETVVLISPR